MIKALLIALALLLASMAPAHAGDVVPSCVLSGTGTGTACPTNESNSTTVSLTTPSSGSTGTGTIWVVIGEHKDSTTVTSCPTTNGHAWTLQAKNENNGVTVAVCTLVPVAGDLGQTATITFGDSSFSLIGLVSYFSFSGTAITVDTAGASGQSSSSTSFSLTAITTAGVNETVEMGASQLSDVCGGNISIPANVPDKLNWLINPGYSAADVFAFHPLASAVFPQKFTSSSSCHWGGYEIALKAGAYLDIVPAIAETLSATCSGTTSCSLAGLPATNARVGPGSIWVMVGMSKSSTTVSSCPTTSGHAWTLGAKNENNGVTSVVCYLAYPLANDTAQSPAITFGASNFIFVAMTPYTSLSNSLITVDAATGSGQSTNSTSFAPTAVTTHQPNELVEIAASQLNDTCGGNLTDPSSTTQNYNIVPHYSGHDVYTAQFTTGTVPTTTFTSSASCDWGGIEIALKSVAGVNQGNWFVARDEPWNYLRDVIWER